MASVAIISRVIRVVEATRVWEFRAVEIKVTGHPSECANESLLATGAANVRQVEKERPAAGKNLAVLLCKSDSSASRAPTGTMAAQTKAETIGAS